MYRRLSRLFLLVVGVGLLTVSAFAKSKSDNDRVQMGRDIHVAPGEKVGDLVCVGCSIYVRGETSGDTVAVGGSITLEGASVAGDSVAVLGSVRLMGDSHVGGDAVAVIGSVRRDAESSVGGDVTSMGGPGWILLILILPLALFGGFVALIVWLIQRSRRRQSEVGPYSGGVPSARV